MTLWMDEISDSVEERARVARSPAEVIPALKEYFGDREIRVLEIGVFRAGLALRIAAANLNVASYDGVDPYLGAGDDPYLGAYWSNQSESHSVYQEAQQAFDKHGYHLHRMSSVEFHRQLKSNESFDLIYVDGDHRLEPALWDTCAFFQHLADDGVLMVDDYANVDAPDVTKAVNAFAQICRANIRRIGYVESWFRNSGKFVPVVQSTVLFLPVPRDSRVDYFLPTPPPTQQDTPASEDSRTSLWDVSPRIVGRRVRSLFFSFIKSLRHHNR